MTSIPKILWQPTQDNLKNTNLYLFYEWLKIHKSLIINDYEDCYNWSVKKPNEFWEAIWQYFDIKSYTPYEKVMSDDPMPNVKWFEGATLNYAEHIFRQKNDTQAAIIYSSENQTIKEVSWQNLEHDTAKIAKSLREMGVEKGDRVVAYLPNIPEATAAFLACSAIGATWSSCSPDFGASSVIDRFAQIKPKVIFAVDGYRYGGKPFDKKSIVKEICDAIPSLEHVIFVRFLDKNAIFEYHKPIVYLDNILAEKNPAALYFEPLPFAHPLYILYSSGTTGIPKAIVHGQGGILLEHLKYLTFHNDVKKNERFFWFSTTGWMMWNFLQSALLVGATAVIYDGSPGYPDMNFLWDFAEKTKTNHFGTSAPFLLASRKANIEPMRDFDLSALRSINSTGSPLPPEAFAYVYEKVKKDVWLTSMSGGTDVCTAWVGGNPQLPVYQGEIQCRCLGAAMESWDEMGKNCLEEVGEMVVTKPMPSMPIFFWNDENKEKYLSSYFEMFPTIWRHGDWLKITIRGSLMILGRSDATLNRQGVRIGTAEIYRAVDSITEVKDALVIHIENEDGTDYMPLFVVMNEGFLLEELVKNKIKNVLKTDFSPRHVPDAIIEVPDIPYTISGKKLETPVKKILQGVALEKAANLGSMRNPSALDFFVAMKSNKNT
jgi:acetoacetyl-CoA synthetase